MKPTPPPPHYVAYRIALVVVLAAAVAIGVWWSVQNDLLTLLNDLLDQIGL